MTLWKQGPQQRPWQKSINNDPVQIAVAGIGTFAQEWVLPAFKQTDYCECPVVVSGRSRPELAETHDVLTYDEFDAGVSAHQYDAVYVTTPNDRHLEIATTAAELGKDILCEKPIEATLPRARRLVDVCAEQNVALMVGNRVQFKPTIRYVRRLIEQGMIGTPVHVHSSSSFDVLSQGGTDQWRLDPERGGGALLDIGVYPINTIRYLLDTDLSPTFVRSHHSSEIDDVEAHSEFHLSLDDGGRAVCTISFAAQP
jgi:xylose dehydrogenase (NAD/NADP)